jgi:hypothetical protein
MHKSASIVVLAALAVAAAGCKKSEPAPEATATAAPAEVATAPAPPLTPTPGNYDVTSTEGKPISKVTINADGTYREVPVKGLPEAGIVKITNGKTCFDPSGKKGPECWTESEKAADGSFTATSDSGSTVKVTPKK